MNALTPWPSDISRHVLAAQRDIQAGQEMANIAGAIFDRRTAYQGARLKLLAAVAMLEELAELPFERGGCAPFSRPDTAEISILDQGATR